MGVSINLTQKKQLCLDLDCAVRFSFSNYVGSEDIISAMLKAFEGRDEYRFVFLYGHSSTGKTHLLKAASQFLLDAGKRVMYIDFSRLNKLTPDLIQGLWGMDLVCLDNIECVSGIKFWEEALFNLFNQLSEHKKPLFVSGNNPPHVIGFSLPDIQTRLCSGVIFKLLELEDEFKLAIMRQRALELGLDLSDSVANYVLNKYSRDLKSLVAKVEFIVDKFLIINKKPTVALLKKAGV